MSKSRLKPEARKEDILAAALPLAAEHGYRNITRNQIAEAAKVSGPTLNYHFGTMAQLQRDLMRHAIARENLRVIAQGISAGDSQAAKVDSELRSRALDYLKG